MAVVPSLSLAKRSFNPRIDELIAVLDFCFSAISALVFCGSFLEEERLGERFAEAKPAATTVAALFCSESARKFSDEDDLEELEPVQLLLLLLLPLQYICRLI